MSAAPDNALIKPWWFSQWPVLLLCALVPLLYAGPATALHGLWLDHDSPTYMHGYLLLLISAALIWRSGEHAPPLSLQPDKTGMALLAVLGLILVVCTQTGLRTPAMTLLPAVAALAVLALFGKAVFQRCLFAIGFLFFALPLCSSINSVLQWGTVFAVRGMLTVADVPVLFEANRVHLPSGSFEVAGGCSGLHFLIAALAIAALLGELNGDTLRRRRKVMILAAAMAIAMNWLRVFSIVLVGHLSQMQNYIVAKSHYGYGWVLFAIMMMVFLYIERRIPWETVPVPDSQSAAAPVRQNPSQPVAASLALAVLVLLLPPLWQSLAARPAQLPSVAVLPTPAAWQTAPVPVLDPWRVLFEGIDEQQQQSFSSSAGQRVDVYLGHYVRQDLTHKFAGYHNSPFVDAPVLQSSTELWQGQPVQLQQVLAPGNVLWLLALQYQVGDRPYADPLQGQFAYALQSLTGGHSPLSTVRILRAQCGADCVSATQLLRTFQASLADPT